MKTKNYLKILIVGLIMVTACKKSNQVKEKPNLNRYADVIVQLERAANEMEFIGRYVPSNIAQYPDDGNFLGRGKIARRGTASGQEITIDFGTGGVCTDGKFRSGKLTILFNETNFDTMIRPAVYKLEDIELNGNYNLGYVAGSNGLRLNLIALDSKITRNGQYWANFSLNRKSEFVQGSNTPNDIADDVYQRTDLSYDVTLRDNNSTFLIKARGVDGSRLAFSCTDRYYPTTGKLNVEFTGAGQGSFLLTFSSGTCNGKPIIN
ncbi:hypothetical protein [Pedobacter nanyangensis]|uniref:hypothetical protein n=1 Tax=Pedobacter nanyangensis TaxID=1562389 RepID=UPI000DE21942|nr:hypothetical protein [Pedobacter nanyangensis]